MDTPSRPSQFKRLFLYCLIGSLIASALVAVVTVLQGKFTDTTGRVLGTLLLVAVHAVISLGFIWDNEKHDTFNRLGFFINVVFTLIVLSFITSIFGTWEILSGTFVAKLYATYGLVAFASLHGNILAKVVHTNRLMIMVFCNYAFIVLVVLTLLPVIYFEDPFTLLGDFYFRILAAFGIIDATLSILVVIFHKMYLHQHPEIADQLSGGTVTPGQAPTHRKGLSIWVWILLGYLVLQFTSTIIGLVFRRF